jgi:acylphosphatase
VTVPTKRELVFGSYYPHQTNDCTGSKRILERNPFISEAAHFVLTMFRLTAHVRGRIQRVGYRAKVVSLAKEMNLTGMVQNRPDGAVLVIAEGEGEALEKFGSAIWIKNTFIDVTGVDSAITAGAGTFLDFRKITGPDEVGERLDDGIEILKAMAEGILDIKVGIQDINVNTQSIGEDIRNLTEITKTGFENLNCNIDKMHVEQDETVEEIRGLREDMKSYMDRRFRKIELELADIRETLKEKGIS